MKMKTLWVRLVRSAAFFVVAITFFSIKFYDISQTFVNDRGFLTGATTGDAIANMFDMVFKQTSLNTLLGIVFIILGGTELIGVKKNGN